MNGVKDDFVTKEGIVYFNKNFFKEEDIFYNEDCSDVMYDFENNKITHKGQGQPKAEPFLKSIFISQFKNKNNKVIDQHYDDLAKAKMFNNNLFFNKYNTDYLTPIELLFYKCMSIDKDKKYKFKYKFKLNGKETTIDDPHIKAEAEYLKYGKIVCCGNIITYNIEELLKKLKKRQMIEDRNYKIQQEQQQKQQLDNQEQRKKQQEQQQNEQQEFERQQQYDKQLKEEEKKKNKQFYETEDNKTEQKNMNKKTNKTLNEE